MPPAGLRRRPAELTRPDHALFIGRIWQAQLPDLFSVFAKGWRPLNLIQPPTARLCQPVHRTRLRSPQEGQAK